MNYFQHQYFYTGFEMIKRKTQARNWRWRNTVGSVAETERTRLQGFVITAEDSNGISLKTQVYNQLIWKLLKA